MSHKGQLQRGNKWYSYRDIDGNLPPGIRDDPNKMKDVNYFLENTKPKEKLKEKK
ncbi:hypothetical protein LCGC14_0851910 [marine sediment metagenome]|uniref:Uncharacterized protein n=1 Tax=marine sediment metagenome TaxID=412755 RepID=A0A0F9PEV0_9ZZZZ